MDKPVKKILICRKQLKTLHHHSGQRRQQLKRCQVIYENDHVILWQTDETGRLTYLNPSVKRMLGYEPDQLEMKKFVHDLFPEICREEYTEKFSNLYVHQQPMTDVTCPIQGADGSIVWFSVNAAPFLDEAGHVTGFVGSARDVTPYIEALDQIKEAEAYKEALLQSIDELVIVLDNYLVCKEVYTSQPNNLLIEENQLMGKPLDHLGIEEPARSLMIEGVRKAQRTGTTLQITYHLSQGNRPGVYTANIAPLKDSNGYQQGVVATIREKING